MSRSTRLMTDRPVVLVELGREGGPARHQIVGCPKAKLPEFLELAVRSLFQLKEILALICSHIKTTIRDIP
eukprot:761552-Hanusia_phi.AAC.3